MQCKAEHIFVWFYAGYGINVTEVNSREIIILFSMCRHAHSCAFISVIELPRIPAYCPKTVICSSIFSPFRHLPPYSLRSSLTIFIITYVATKVKSYFSLFKNLFTKYCCPFPVTSTVFVIRTLPSGLLIVRSLISNRPASMLLCVGIL